MRPCEYAVYTAPRLLRSVIAAHGEMMSWNETGFNLRCVRVLNSGTREEYTRKIPWPDGFDRFARVSPYLDLGHRVYDVGGRRHGVFIIPEPTYDYNRARSNEISKDWTTYGVVWTEQK